ncbi:unnamed protein product [Heligmosomoides polygyrus]|uniref:Uncharacterized protein n=1 Tax=Heligmosomoides polygyrus TaxID=6339 RepID=A0A183FL37_HELPZ|nr:unnamed protein product [Heligmosomoides polygyrus]
MIQRILCLLCLLLLLSVPPTASQSHEIERRRIGMRLPNLVQFKPVSQKRRIGMRLPNIIYLRSEPEKKNTWEYASL